MSVVCWVDAQAGEKWFVVRESGRVPEGYGTAEASASLAQGYVVVVHAGGCSKEGPIPYGMKPCRFVMVAQLTEDSLWKVKHRVVPAMRRNSWEDDALWQCTDGALSSGRECSCVLDLWPDLHAICLDCSRVPEESRVFVAAHRFEGIRPWGENDWWKGVTDVPDTGDAEEAEYDYDRWLVEAQRDTDTHQFPFGPLHLVSRHA
jgi:hypothetical protein